jgi:hypothetical protein
MILCEWDAPEGDPGQSCVHLFARNLSTPFSSVSIFSVCFYSIVSISMVTTLFLTPVSMFYDERLQYNITRSLCYWFTDIILYSVHSKVSQAETINIY